MPVAGMVVGTAWWMLRVIGRVCEIVCLYKLPKTAEGGIQSHPHPYVRPAQDFGRFSSAESVDVAQHNDRAVIRFQSS